MDEEFSLHFRLGEVKSGLSEVRDKLDDIRTGEVRSRGSGESQVSVGVPLDSNSFKISP